jgi:hypothetical protein
MMPEEMLDDELPFRSDFAARVLDKAEAITARRRRVRATIAVTSAVLLVGLFMVGMWRMPQTPFPAGHVPRQVAGIGSGEMTFAQSAQMEPLDYFFPEARSLSQFMDQYGGSDSATEDDAVFFPNARDVASEEVDGS